MQIGKIGSASAPAAQKAAAKSNASQKLSSNPFGVSFKGNMIQADVFQSGAKKAAAGLSGKSKMFASAAASGINSFSEAFKSRMNAIGAFAKKIVSNVFDSMEKIGSTELKFDLEAVKNKINPDRAFSNKVLLNTPVSEIGSKWRGLITPAAA